MIIGLIVPFLNEERYLGTLLESIAAQERLPDRLLLVDDGSSDGSFAIAREFAAAHPFATALRRPPRPPERDRLATAAELVAFKWGLERLEEPWDVVAKLDADLRLTPDTLATLERELEADRKLGLVGPYLSYLGRRGRPVRERFSPGHVGGTVKFYRRACFEHISPLPPILGWDTIDEVRARMRGWSTRSVELAAGDPLHLRPMGSHDGTLRGYRRWGLCAYAYGAHPAHVLLSAAVRLRYRPVLLGGVSYLAGWAMAALRGAPRAEPELRAFVRREQLRRIRGLASGAAKA